MVSEMDVFMSEWDDYLHLTGHPMRFASAAVPALVARGRRRRKLVLWVIVGFLIAALFIQFSQPAPRPLSSLDNGPSETVTAQLTTARG